MSFKQFIYHFKFYKTIVLLVFILSGCCSRNENLIKSDNISTIMLINSDFPSNPINCYPQKDSLECYYKIKFKKNSKEIKSKFNENGTDSIIYLSYKQSQFIVYQNVKDNKFSLTYILVFDKEIFFNYGIKLGLSRCLIAKIFPEILNTNEKIIELTDGSELSSVLLHFNKRDELYKMEYINNDEM